MSLSPSVRREIINLLRTKLREKLENYEPETDCKPFHHGLFGKELCAVTSFMHSLYTSLGMSIWEQVANILASSAGYNVSEKKIKLNYKINRATSEKIEEIHEELMNEERDPDKRHEIREIRKVAKGKPSKKQSNQTVDFFMKIKD